MRQNLRPKVILPVAVLALLGAGFGAYASGRAPESGSSASTVPIVVHHTKPNKPQKPNKPKPPASPLEGALRANPVVVAAFYLPGRDVDSAAVREARAGALAANQGFIAVNVKRNSEVTPLAEKYEVSEAPAILLFVRGPKVVARFSGFVDRTTVEQAAKNAH